MFKAFHLHLESMWLRFVSIVWWNIFRFQWHEIEMTFSMGGEHVNIDYLVLIITSEEDAKMAIFWSRASIMLR